MGNPAYYILDPDEALEFPVAPRYGSSPHSIEEGDLTLTTERGKVWVYKKYRKKIPRVNVRVSETQLQFFKTLHLAVGGQETPFYYAPDSDDMATVFYVRKEPNFEPVELEEEGVFGGVVEPVYDYTLILREEPTGPDVEE
jgi:hypothetical protein